MKNYKLRKLLTLAAIALVTSVAMHPTKASAAWKQSNNGNWSYIEGNTSVSGWKSIDGKWYFFDNSRTMKTGWINDGGSWYYIAPSGEMKTGWINDGGKWYYTAPSGAMQTGWLSSNGVWYHLNTSGAMQTGLVELNGKTYYLNESGAMQTGNVVINGANYTFNANGEKTNVTNVQETTANTTQTPETTQTDSSASGGSGSSGGGSGSGGGSSNVSYDNLYGTWTVGDYVDNGKKTSLTDEQISLLEGKQLTITSDSIDYSEYSVPISKSSVKTTTMTSSAFKDKYNIEISGDKVTSYTTTIKYSSVSSGVTVFVSDDGESYALVKGALFEFEK